MLLPQSDFHIFIGPHKISVVFRDDMPEDFGQWDGDNLLISIRRGLPPSLMLSTLLHELCHATETLYFVRISHKDLNLIADMLAMAVLQISQKQASANI